MREELITTIMKMIATGALIAFIVRVFVLPEQPPEDPPDEPNPEPQAELPKATVRKE